MKNERIIEIEIFILIFLVLLMLIFGIMNTISRDDDFASFHYQEVQKVKRYYEEMQPDGLYLLDPVIIKLDDLSFQEAFRIVRAVRGNNAIFYWKGNKFSTNKE